MKPRHGIGAWAGLLLLAVLYAMATSPKRTAAGAIAPYPEAPLCPDSGEDHDRGLFHELWDPERGCHYDHEHGRNPFTPEVAAALPGFDLYGLLGQVGVSHTNPSSEQENDHKHGGHKWDVTLSHTAGCTASLQAPTGVDAFVAQYHALGDYQVELEARRHSAVGLLRFCRTGNPSDKGYAFFNQIQDYGQRVSPYQGAVLPYPDNPSPAYGAGLAPYFSVDCLGTPAGCRPSIAFLLGLNADASSTWVSRPQFPKNAPPIGGSPLFAILFRVRDTYQLVEQPDSSHPFAFRWICSADGGATFEATPGCRWNNSTTRIHELHGEIPAAWDGLPGFDLDPRPGRVTADGFVTALGALNPACSQPGPDCHPLKLIGAFTGKYASTFALVGGKGSFAPSNLPERDICFSSSGTVVTCETPGARPSGWIGPGN